MEWEEISKAEKTIVLFCDDRNETDRSVRWNITSPGAYEASFSIHCVIASPPKQFLLLRKAALTAHKKSGNCKYMKDQILFCIRHSQYIEVLVLTSSAGKQFI